jgi:hypothetical protein
VTAGEKLSVWEAVDRRLREIGSNNTAPGLLQIWQHFVETCEHGYQYSAEDYYEDIKVRHVIQQVLEDERLKQYSQYAELCAEVERRDMTFRKILLPVILEPSKPWWEASVPQLAGPDLAAAIEADYGIKLRIVE